MKSLKKRQIKKNNKYTKSKRRSRSRSRSRSKIFKNRSKKKIDQNRFDQINLKIDQKKRRKKEENY